MLASHSDVTSQKFYSVCLSEDNVLVLLTICGDFLVVDAIIFKIIIDL